MAGSVLLILILFLMPTFKNTLDILTNPWTNEFSKTNVVSNILPTSNKWNEDREIKIDDIILWEQLYYEPGNIGIYVAYNPCVEFYLITYNLFFNSEHQFEEFYGDGAAQQCFDRAVELGIQLPFS